MTIQLDDDVVALDGARNLKRTQSNGSRFREDFDDNDDVEPARVGKQATNGTSSRISSESTRNEPKVKSMLFSRRAKTHNPPSVLTTVSSRTPTVGTTTSHESIQSAHSRRVPSFMSGSTSPTSPTSPPRSPVVPASPRSLPLANPARPASKASTPKSPAISQSSRLPEAEADSSELTTQDRHYICRILSNLQFQREFSALSQIGTLSNYGAPFLPHANGPNSRPPDLVEKKGSWFGFLGATSNQERAKEWEGYAWDDEGVVDSPLCRYLFYRFIENMPALRTAKPTYWSEQIQQFFDSFAERDLSSTKERGEITKRRMLATGITRIVGSYVSSSLRPIGPAAPARPSTSTMRRVDLLVPGSMDSLWRILFPQQPIPEYNAWVGVVEESECKGVTTFRIVSQVRVVEGRPLFHALRTWRALQRFASSLASIDSRNELGLPILPYVASRLTIQTYLRQVVILLSYPPRSLADLDTLIEARNTLETFLLGAKETIPKRDLEEWLARGIEMEAIDEKRHHKWVAVGKRVKSLRTTWVKYRRSLIETNELDKTMELVRKNLAVKNFPKEYRDAEEWARIWVAYALHYVFVDSANGAEILNILKGFHDLIPYGAIKVGLQLVNPTLAIRAIVQLVLGQPVGQQSLFQRIWSIICNTAIKHQKKLIEAYRKKISRATVADVLERHVRAPYVERQRTKQAAIDNDEDIVLTIMRERGSGSDIELVDKWHDEFERANLAKSTGTTKFEDAKNLLAAYYRLRDREQVLAIALEPNTPRLLHATIAVFYSTIHKVANASKLSDRVGDMQAFLDDLIKVAMSDKKSPPEFLKLVDRHHEKLYYFVHELAANGGTLLDPLLAWAKSGLAFLGKGIPPPSKTSSPYKRAGVDVEALLDSLPTASAATTPTMSSHAAAPPTREGVLAEARHFATWTAYKKAYHDLCLRVDLLECEATDSAKRSDLRAMHLEKEKMWQELLAQDREAMKHVATNVDDEGKARTDAGQDLEWAWWSADELAGAAGRAKVTIALPTSTPGASSHDSKPQPKKLSRSKSSTLPPSDSYHVIDANDVPEHPIARAENDRLEIPAPSVKITKTLLDRYLEQIRGALADAKARSVK
ncbi:hypothetical protein JCM10212_007076 [Sporobolomyces blumeae]